MSNLNPKRRRRGIFVENQTKKNSAPSGAAYSADSLPTQPGADDAAPDGTWKFYDWFLQICRPAGAENEMDFQFYKYTAPMALNRGLALNFSNTPVSSKS
jgi:hypothetical protein